MKINTSLQNHVRTYAETVPRMNTILTTPGKQGANNYDITVEDTLLTGCPLCGKNGIVSFKTFLVCEECIDYVKKNYNNA